MTKARVDQPDTTAELSEAARAAVRDPGDPRIDAHLAALGLGPDPASPPPVPQPRAGRTERSESAELVAVRARADELERALAGARLQVRGLRLALLVALGAFVAVLILLLVNLGA